MGKEILKQPLSAYSNFDLGINERYGISSVDMEDIRKWLNRQTLSNDYLYNNQSEYMVSIRAYPFWVNKIFKNVGADVDIAIGPFSSTNIRGRKLTQPFPDGPIAIGTYDVPRYYGNFMDYAPHTKIVAYIPYVSFVELDVNEIMGKTITFYMMIDFDTGQMTIYLENTTDGVMIQTWNTHIGIDVALNRTNGTDLARNLYMWGITASTQVGSMMLKPDLSKAVAGAGKIGTGYITANQRHVERGSISIGMNELFNPKDIYLIISRDVPEITDLTEYRKLYGLPLERTVNLSTLSGYTRVGDIHLENFDTATESELNEIESLLRTGVIL